VLLVEGRRLAHLICPFALLRLPSPLDASHTASKTLSQRKPRPNHTPHTHSTQASALSASFAIVSSSKRFCSNPTHAYAAKQALLFWLPTSPSPSPSLHPSPHSTARGWHPPSVPAPPRRLLMAAAAAPARLRQRQHHPRPPPSPFSCMNTCLPRGLGPLRPPLSPSSSPPSSSCGMPRHPRTLPPSRPPSLPSSRPWGRCFWCMRPRI